jgi:hypothetical protein
MEAKIKLYHQIIVRDENGKIIKKTRLEQSHSFVLQFLQFIECLMCHPYGSVDATASVKDLGGTGRALSIDVPVATQVMACFAPDNISAYGIRVGSGTTTPTNADVDLATLIAHGTGAGQLDYGTHSRTAAQVVGANVDLVISRAFYNGSGATVTIKEIGTVATYKDNDSFQRYALIMRDVLSASVDVENAKTATVQYTMRTTV